MRVVLLAVCSMIMTGFGESALFAATKTNTSWGDVTTILSNFHNLSNVDPNCSECRGFAFTAGDASGRRYTFEKGSIKTSTPLLMASSSKFPAAIAIAGVVADGHLTFDTFAHQIFPWWASDPRDLRAGVTLRHLLSFRSGFYWEDASSGNCSCLAGLESSILWTPEACAKQIYNNAPFKYEPGSTFAYNSFHLQVAGAMAAKAAGISVQELLHKYLIGKLGLKRTGWLIGQNPMLAAAMHTTADDYDVILQKYLSYELVSKDIAEELERDYLANGTQLCDWCSNLTAYLGHYSFCNWYECLSDLPNATFTTKCMEAKIHNDAGLFGYYPLFDRNKGMYMQIAQSVIVGLNDTNPGVDGALVLRQLVKPHVDAALGVAILDRTGTPSALPTTSLKRIDVAKLEFPELSALTRAQGVNVWNEMQTELSRMVFV